MFKKDFAHLSDKYNSHLYTGLIGKLMRKNHNLMEKNKNLFDEKTRILEIGAGTYPHITHLKHKYKSYSVIDIDESDMLKDYYRENNFDINFEKYNGFNIPFNNESFDRIVMSHCLEHITKPELFLDEVIRVMDKNAVLSVSLPTDPGIMWRISRNISKKYIQKKTYNVSEIEYDYINSIEHVNSIFNLEIILNKKFRLLSKLHYPTYLPFHDINIFYIADYTRIK